MATIKCKMCGGDINIDQTTKTVECEYCGSMQTVPIVHDNEQLFALHNRANTFRLKQEFDKAMNTYEAILTEAPKDAEAHYGMFLCKYGVTYVTDFDGTKKPTINRMQLRNVFDDVDYKEALALSDVVTRRIYEEEGTRIASIQKRALAISQNEAPYDIFICYKETGADSKRTIDSVIAEQIYNELVKAGYKVFFSRITLENMLGTEYEPYIFAALNSSKVMLAIGSRPEYFNAVWVKNEWSRFLYLMNEHPGTKYLFPCYRDMEVYDLPDEMVTLQAQDLNKLGFIQDLLRGINKVFGKKETNQSSGQNQSSSSYDGLLKRAQILIESGDFKKADETLEKVLDQNPECGKAYLYKLLIECNYKTIDDLKETTLEIEKSQNYKLLLKYGTKDEIEMVEYPVKNRSMIMAKKNYNEALLQMKLNNPRKAIEIFIKYPDYLDTKEKIKECYVILKEEAYNKGIELMKSNMLDDAIKQFKMCPTYKDSSEKIEECELMKKEAIYSNGIKLMESAKWDEAIEQFNLYLDYKDSAEKIEECQIGKINQVYLEAKKLYDDENFLKAAEVFKSIESYSNSKGMIEKCFEGVYEQGLNEIDKKRYNKAIIYFNSIIDFRDSKEKIEECRIGNKQLTYDEALKYISNNDYITALNMLDDIRDYKDSAALCEKYRKKANKQEIKNRFSDNKYFFILLFILSIILFLNNYRSIFYIFSEHIKFDSLFDFLSTFFSIFFVFCSFFFPILGITLLRKGRLFNFIEKRESSSKYFMRNFFLLSAVAIYRLFYITTINAINGNISVLFIVFWVVPDIVTVILGITLFRKSKYLKL